MADDPIARARALIGTRFRLHGRDPAHGLDCIGLVGAAYGIDDLPSGYALHGGDVARLHAELRARGFHELRNGTLIVAQPGPAQLHLGIRDGDIVIHADALLRRVVAVPGVPWPILTSWQRD